MKKILLIILLFFLIYPAGIVILPQYSIRLLMSIPGLFLFIYDTLSKRISFRKISFFIFWNLLIIAIDLIFHYVNDSSDFSRMGSFVAITLYIFSVYLVYRLANSMKLNIIKLLPYVFTIQLIFIIFMNLTDYFYNTVQMVFTQGDNEIDMRDVRFRALGMNFFHAGVINSFSLLFIIHIILYYANNIVSKIYLMVLFLLLSFFGLIVARTTLVGILISLAYLFINTRKKITYFTYLSIVGLIFLFLAIPIFEANYREYFDFGFEMFNNYSAYGKVETSSTNTLMELWKIHPESIKTWIIGDSQWSAAFGMYYMFTDVGYFRNIFYFGLVGTLLFFMYFFFIARKTKENNTINGKLSYCFLILLLILLIKGDASEVVPFYILYFDSIYNCNTILKKLNI